MLRKENNMKIGSRRLAFICAITLAITLTIVSGCGMVMGASHERASSGTTANRILEAEPTKPGFLSKGDESPRDLKADVAAIPSERKVITTASISMEVESLDEAYKSLTEIANRSGGYVSGSNYDVGYDNVKSGSITLRIPQKGYESVIASIRALGEVESENTSGNDVTEEYVDLKARLSNKKKVEERFTEILDRAITIADILKVEREIASVREEIERMTGRINYLENMTSLATITVSLHEAYGTAPERIPDKWIASKVFKAAWKSFHESATSILTAMIWILVYLPILIFFFLVLKLAKSALQRVKKHKS